MIRRLYARLRRRTVRVRSGGTTRRRPSDAVRVVVAAAVLTGLAFHADSPTATERAVVRWFNTLPAAAETFFLVFYDLLALWAVLLLAVTVLFVRRLRLARDLLVAGAAAWLFGRLLAFVWGRTSLSGAFELVFDVTNAPRFPTVRVAIAVAMVIVASPHLTRPVRRVGQVLVALLALSAMYLGRAYPTDLVGAIVLGWGVAAAVHLAFGTPDRRPTVGQVHGALAHLGIVAADLHPAAHQPVGRAVFVGDTDDGRVRVTALGRDEADAQLIARAWRYLAYRDTTPTLFPTRRQQVEYEAYVELLARDAGVAAPRVVVAGANRELALLVEEIPAGPLLADVGTSRVTDALLRRIWQELAELHAARVAHGALDARHVVVGERGRPVITGFEAASTTAGGGPMARDVAQLLGTTSALVGPQRSLRAARAVVGDDALDDALPLLQAPVMTGATRDELDAGALGELRERGARMLRRDPPELRQLYRVHPRSILMAVAALLAVGFLLSRIGDPADFWNSVRDASWEYVAIAFVLGMLTDAAFAIAFLGTVPTRIGLWPSVLLQSSMSFSNLAVPVAADAAMQVRFLQKQGLDLTSAVATGGVLSSVSEIAVQVGLLFLAIWLAPDKIDFGNIDTDQILIIGLVAVFLIGVAIAVVFSIRSIRRAVVPAITRAALTVWAAVKTPGKLALMIGGNVVAQCFYAGSLLACLAAFGQSVNFWTLLALNIGISTIASLVPIPGGGTAVSAIGLAGMLTAFGVPESATAAAVLAHQLAVSYVPAIPGWFATRALLRRGLL
ncbi:MAG TPA: lysylphosphatidylglycerol synthase domain-containing protein [Acidimicrobiia bacterium]